MVEQFNKKSEFRKRESMDLEMEQKLTSEEEGTRLEAEEYFKKREEEMLQEDEELPEIKYPAFIPLPDRLSVVVWGRPGHGKSKMARYLATKHERLLLVLDEVIDYHIQNETDIGKQISEFLAECQAEMDVAREAREKLLK
jgi:hypothetical protein